MVVSFIRRRYQTHAASSRNRAITGNITLCRSPQFVLTPAACPKREGLGPGKLLQRFKFQSSRRFSKPHDIVLDDGSTVAPHERVFIRELGAKTGQLRERAPFRRTEIRGIPQTTVTKIRQHHTTIRQASQKNAETIQGRTCRQLLPESSHTYTNPQRRAALRSKFVRSAKVS